MKKSRLFLIFSGLLILGCDQSTPQEPEDDGETDDWKDWNAEHHLQLSKDMIAMYQGLLQSLSPAEARQTLMETFRDVGGMSDVELGADSTSIWYRYFGRPTFFQTFTSEDVLPLSDGDPAFPSFRESNMKGGDIAMEGACSIPHSKSALILSADERARAGRHRSAELPPLYANIGYTVFYATPSLITLDHFKIFDEYGVVILITHSGVGTDGRVYLLTGVLQSDELDQSHFADLNSEPLNLVARHHGEDPRLWYSISPSWMTKYYPPPAQLNNSLMIVGSCASKANPSMSSTIVTSTNESMYYGWTSSVDYFDSMDCIYRFSELLTTENETCAVAHRRLGEEGLAQFVYPVGTTQFVSDGNNPSLALVCYPHVLKIEVAGVQVSGGSLTLNGVLSLAFPVTGGAPGYFEYRLFVPNEALKPGVNTITIQSPRTGPPWYGDDWDDIQCAKIRFEDREGQLDWSIPGTYHLGDDLRYDDPNKDPFWTPLIGPSVTIEFQAMLE